VSNDADSPISGDDEWNTRLNLIYQSIGKWELNSPDWRELWKTYTHASTVANADVDYTLTLTDMKRPGGWLKLTLDGVESLIEVVSPEQSQKYDNARVVWFTGNNYAGWTLNLGWTPTAGDGTIGATISFPYYKYAFVPALTTDEVEMSDPNFIIYDVAATKSLMESKNNLWSVYNTEAQNCMDRMMAMNELNPPYQNNTIEDLDAINGSVMGE
jgi:hypothetical protein